MFNLCVPVLNNYEGLNKLIISAFNSVMLPEAIFIIDNGGQAREYNWSFPNHLLVFFHNPGYNMGVAGSWNWFIDNIPQPRIISNDDIELYPETLRKFSELYDPNRFCYAHGTGDMNSFSFFYLPTRLIELIGKFDEEISPNYGYFEDNDYSHRLSKVGEGFLPIDVSIGHVGSNTMKNYSNYELNEHHRKFRLARANYIKKWGGVPGKELYERPFNL